MIVEICANSFESAIAAQNGGANRIELCTQLAVGGLTPTHQLIKKVMPELSIPVHVLVRPRKGNFCYSKEELNIMKNDIEFCKSIGCSGVVSGILKSDLTIDLIATKQLIEVANGIDFTFHRAFDCVKDPLKSLKHLIDLKVKRVLSSELKPNAIIGTSSLRREFQIKKIRNDINCKLIRGNVDTRIKKLNDGLYDAIILSYAGIKSLSIEDKIAEIFSTQEIIPSAGQGIISLQCRNDDKNIISILDSANDQKTYLRAHAERNVLKVLEGDCETAVGVHSVIEGDEIILEAELFSLDGKQRFYEKKSSKIENSKSLGEEVGKILKVKSNNSYKK